jgi:hypothetical protein
MLVSSSNPTQCVIVYGRARLCEKFTKEPIAEGVFAVIWRQKSGISIVTA